MPGLLVVDVGGGGGGGAGQFVICIVFFAAGGFFEMSLLDVTDVASDVCVAVGVGGFWLLVSRDGGRRVCRGWGGRKVGDSCGRGIGGAGTCNWGAAGD